MSPADGLGLAAGVASATGTLPLSLDGDLAALVARSGDRLTTVQTLSRQLSPANARASFRLELADGRTLKARLVPSAQHAERVSRLSRRLVGLPFAQVLARHGRALLEQWLDGAPLAGRQLEIQTYEQAGELLGRLACVAIDEDGRPMSPRGSASRLDKLDRDLGRLTAAGLIEADLARRLHGLASGNAPAALDVGIVHQDLQPQNLLRCDGELWAIDPELLDVSALDADLGRSCYLWPMPDLARQAFLRGYERYRSATPFVQHELFWAIVSVAGGARYWHEVGPLDHRLIAALHALARGELPLPWVRDPVVSIVGQGRRIRVAVVCDYLAIGGQERVILNLLKGLDRSRFEPFVYAFRGGEMVAAVEAAGAPLTIGSLKEPLGWRDWNGEDMREKDDWNRRLADALRRDGIDAAFVFAWDGGIEAARRAGVPVLIERLDGPGLLGKLPDKSAFDKLICESSTIRALLLERATELRLNPDRIEVIYSGIDLERFDPSRYDRVGMRREIGIEDEDVVIATISRLAPGKNIELLMQALIQVRRDRPARPIRLLVMGPDHGALESLQRMAGEHPLLGERVLFLPPCENVAPTLAAADIFAMTSVGEGIPNAILEAMAMGLPIVSTRVGSIHEVVHRNGMLAGAGDAGAVASCLARLIDRPEDRQRMARESRSVAQRYGLRATMGRYEDLVVNLLGRARRDP